ncbi:MAG: SCO family protein [Bermanella sp.]
MNTFKKNLFALLSLILGSVFALPIAASEVLPDMSVYHLEGEWTNHEGKSLSLQELSGKPVVAAMVYTSCIHTCSMMTSKVLEIQKQLPAHQQDKITYALITFDSKGDTVDALSDHKEKRKLDENWVLLRADDSNIRRLAGVLGVNYKEVGPGEFSHSNIISLLDKDGVLVTQINGLNKATTPITNKLESLL